MLGVTLCCIPVVIAYQAWVYYTFAHKVTPEAPEGRSRVLSYVGEGRKGTLLEKGCLLPSPHTPFPHPPKTFDWWGGGAEGVPCWKKVSEKATP